MGFSLSLFHAEWMRRNATYNTNTNKVQQLTGEIVPNLSDQYDVWFKNKNDTFIWFIAWWKQSIVSKIEMHVTFCLISFDDVSISPPKYDTTNANYAPHKIWNDFNRLKRKERLQSMSSGSQATVQHQRSPPRMLRLQGYSRKLPEASNEIRELHRFWGNGKRGRSCCFC